MLSARHQLQPLWCICSLPAACFREQFLGQSAFSEGLLFSSMFQADSEDIMGSQARWFKRRVKETSHATLPHFLRHPCLLRSQLDKLNGMLDEIITACRSGPTPNQTLNLPSSSCPSNPLHPPPGPAYAALSAGKGGARVPRTACPSLWGETFAVRTLKILARKVSRALQ